MPKTDSTKCPKKKGRRKKKLKTLAHLFVAILCWTIAVDKAVSVHDGDTFTINASVWVDMTIRERVRVLAIDTDELDGPKPDKAAQATLFTKNWLNRGPFKVDVCMRDAFGRLLGRVYRDDSVLADDLKAAGFQKDKPVKPK